MQSSNTAIVLVGFQNDYFAEDGILREFVEGDARDTTLQNVTHICEQIKRFPDLLLIATPIQFTPDYSEITDPVGILKAIIEVGAFRQGKKGTETIPLLADMGQRVVQVPGRRGLNAFSNTDLEDILHEHRIRNIVLAGTVTSLCVDSTARSAFERGFQVHILADCTAGRTDMEQRFYTEEVFPMYARVLDHHEFLRELEEK
jgi:nicotinamidase-related amidase